ncbi:hypothetical protein [Hymenobacter volaticus]|uniref:Outer membrane protein beta-barrel domain-containing protein n=1 Tax=Hymenobacter volaticus TaxID=2932254 RepID=A0ABY4GAV3_9BACT|nr:hypothetical protein [Hymenobacter volaticus]UOQ67569.1 hypothetical protein MUN86_06780 [Hymenobacter volaticus]
MRKILLLLFCIYSHFASGQVFEAGYVVLSQGDTLRGEVENAFWEDTPTSIRFRSATKELTTYSGRQLRTAYLASGRLLRKELLPIDRSAQTDITRLTASVRGQQQMDSVLADVIVIGPSSLLSLTLQNVKHFFVRREARPYLEMAERRYLITDAQGTKRAADGNDYKNQLRVYYGDCPAAMAAVDKGPFTAEGLRAVVQTYNQQCSAIGKAGLEIRREETKQAKVIVRLGLVAGVRYNSLRSHNFGYTAQTRAVLDKYNLDGQLNLQGGGYLDLVNAGRRLALHAALLISRFGNSGIIDLPTLDSNESATFQRHGTLLSLQYGVRGFPAVGQQLQVVLGGGFEVNQILTSTSEFEYIGVRKDFLYGFKSNLLPYLEAGLSRDRLALVFTGRLYEKENYSHYASKANPRLMTYEVTPWSLSASLSYRLNANPDLRDNAKPTR